MFVMEMAIIEYDLEISRISVEDNKTENLNYKSLGKSNLGGQWKG